jgi:hypothetical protein
MWHFWGEPEILKGLLKVTGTNQESGRQIIVLKDLALGGANNGADVHVPSNMSLPSSGIWRLDAYIGENRFGSITVQVHDQK